ncbi:hypothetical protein VNO77_00069 [Canavalia gladiata]|uniref:Uncharacterized protein n=1 Tax=Canavalia gladiata TaxID=3824 RepID=A0AAN9MV45_CANGL
MKQEQSTVPVTVIELRLLAWAEPRYVCSFETFWVTRGSGNPYQLGVAITVRFVLGYRYFDKLPIQGDAGFQLPPDDDT